MIESIRSWIESIGQSPFWSKLVEVAASVEARVVTALTLVLALLAVHYARRSYKIDQAQFNEKNSRLHNKAPQPGISFYGAKDAEVISLLLPLGGGGTLIVPFEVEIINTSDREFLNLIYTLEVHSDLYNNSVITRRFNNVGLVLKVESYVDTIKDTSHAVATTTLERVMPGTAVALTDFLTISRSEVVRIAAEASSQVGGELMSESELYLPAAIHISVAGSNITPRKRVYSLRIISCAAQDADEVIEALADGRKGVVERKREIVVKFNSAKDDFRLSRSVKETVRVLESEPENYLARLRNFKSVNGMEDDKQAASALRKFVRSYKEAKFTSLGDPEVISIFPEKSNINHRRRGHTTRP